MSEIQIPWYKNEFNITCIAATLSFLCFFNQCSTGSKVSQLQQQNLELVKVVNENKQTIKEFESIIKVQIEQSFTQNLLYTDAIQKGKMSSQDIQKRFDALTKKLNEQKSK